MTMTAEQMVNGVDTERLEQTAEAVRNDAQLGKLRFRAKNQWIEGGHNCAKVKDFSAGGKEITREKPFEMPADEPPLLLGADRGPNPVEYLLGALSSCMTTTMVYHAAANGIKIEDLESDFEGDLDLQGFLGQSKDVRPGYQNIRATFRVKSDADPERLASFTKFSPVFDVVSRSVPVSVNIVKK